MADGIDVEQIEGSGTLDTDLLFADEAKGNSIRDILQRFGNKLQEDLRQSLDNKKKTTSGDLRQSINFNVKITGSIYTFALTMSDYWQWVDEGRAAGKRPPIEPIRKWVSEKAAFGGLDVKKKDVNSVAFLIARKIGKFGIKPSNFFKDVINDGRVGELEDELNNVFGSII